MWAKIWEWGVIWWHLFKYLGVRVESGEIVQLVKCLTCKYKVMSSIPRTQVILFCFLFVFF